MKSLWRILSLIPCLMFASSFLLADLPPFSPPVTLDVGSALVDGAVAFTLNASDGISALSMHVMVAAGDSPSAVAAKIVAAVNLNYGWSAQASGGAVTFAHLSGGGGWSSVAYVGGLSNTAGALMYLSADASSGAQWGGISISIGANASGRIIGNNGPPSGSTLTLRINGITAPYVVNLSSGQSPASIINGIAGYLYGNLGGAGSCSLTTSGLSIVLNTDHAAFNIVTNDSGLQGAVVVAEAASGIPIGGSGGIGHNQGGNPPQQ